MEKVVETEEVETAEAGWEVEREEEREAETVEGREERFFAKETPRFKR